MKKGLRVKVFRMNIIPVAAAVILFLVLSIVQVHHFAGIMERTNREQNAVIMDTMSDTMRDIATESFQKIVVAEARILDGEFWAMRHDLEVLARQVQMVLEQPAAAVSGEVSPPLKENAGEVTLQLLYSDDADRSDPEMLKQIRLIAGLGDTMLAFVEDTKTLEDCIVVLPGGASIIADRTPEDKFDAEGELRSFNVDRRPWYVGALVHGETYFSPVNLDSFRDIYEVMTGVPVYANGKLAAVCGGAITLESVGEIISNAQLGEYTETCLINENGNVIYATDTDGELGMTGNELKSLKESSNAELVTLVNEALEGKTGFSLIPVDGEETYVAYAPIETLGWTQLLTISQEDLNRAGYLLTQQTDAIMEASLNGVRDQEKWTIVSTLLIAAGLILLAAVISLLFANGLVRPIKHMTRRVSQMQGDDMVFEVDKTLRTDDEIEVLANAFADMSRKMQGYVREIVQITSDKQRMETELSVAAAIQTNMLPTDFPAFPGRKEFDLYAVMDPAREVGGDFYDFFLIDEDHLAVVMADVSGKGVPAALFMVISKTLIKNVALSGLHDSPAQILSDVNDRLCEGNDDDNMFVTVWLGILTISTGHMVSACAGHEYPVFYRKGEGFVLEKDPHGMVMGGLSGLRFRDVQWKLNPGDMLFLYTDGVPEANNSREELFGTDRMLEALEKSFRDLNPDIEVGEGKNLAAESDNKSDSASDTSPNKTDLQAFLRLVRERIDDFVGDTPQFDDLTMLCLEYDGDRGTDR